MVCGGVKICFTHLSQGSQWPFAFFLTFLYFFFIFWVNWTIEKSPVLKKKIQKNFWCNLLQNPPQLKCYDTLSWFCEGVLPSRDFPPQDLKVKVFNEKGKWKSFNKSGSIKSESVSMKSESVSTSRCLSMTTERLSMTIKCLFNIISLLLLRKGKCYFPVPVQECFVSSAPLHKQWTHIQWILFTHLTPDWTPTTKNH